MVCWRLIPFRQLVHATAGECMLGATSICGVKFCFVLIMDAWAPAFLRGTNCYEGNNSLRIGGPCHQGL